MPIYLLGMLQGTVRKAAWVQTAFLNCYPGTVHTHASDMPSAMPIRSRYRAAGPEELVGVLLGVARERRIPSAHLALETCRRRVGTAARLGLSEYLPLGMSVCRHRRRHVL